MEDPPDSEEHAPGPSLARSVPEKWTIWSDEALGRLFILVQGLATEDKARQATRRFIELLGSRSVDVVADLNGVTGYTTAGRRVWQDCLHPVRSQLRRILVVGRDIPVLVRMGASVVAAFTGIPIRFFRTYADLAQMDASEP